MKRTACFSLALATAVFAALLLGNANLSGPATADAAPPEANQVAQLMKIKLEHAERVLEAIAIEDFELLAKESQALSLLTQEEMFQVLVTPGYVRHSLEFGRVADSLTKAARDHNLDGAALAYVDLTMKCVNCHKYVRDVRMASTPSPLFQLR